VQVVGSNPAVIEAMVRRLPPDADVGVRDPVLASAVAARLARPIVAVPYSEVDVVVAPFAATEWSSALPAPVTVVAEHNALSYKTLLAPGSIKLSAWDVVRWVRRRGAIAERVGVMGPDFIVLWTFVEVIGRRRSDLHFRLRDLAMQRIFRRGALWSTGYVVVVAGRHA
jgi:hypothetical protein